MQVSDLRLTVVVHDYVLDRRHPAVGLLRELAPMVTARTFRASRCLRRIALLWSSATCHLDARLSAPNLLISVFRLDEPRMHFNARSFEVTKVKDSHLSCQYLVTFSAVSLGRFQLPLLRNRRTKLASHEHMSSPHCDYLPSLCVLDKHRMKGLFAVAYTHVSEHSGSLTISE